MRFAERLWFLEGWLTLSAMPLISSQKINSPFVDWKTYFRFCCSDAYFLFPFDWVNTYCNVAGQACQRASLKPLRVGTQNNHPQHSNELMMSKGMRYANQALLSGCSAGGLAAILHCDEFRNLFPQNTKVNCLSDAGLFMNAWSSSIPRFITRETYMRTEMATTGTKDVKGSKP
ncbi:unnamed protein product [Cuscuta campestris]|uniref:Pectin acetylesterase n=1 Tax=Cuscuta campestris TaxID=132261 RepID=A0A484LWA3_9ASTE|nr:unnamed protein product [Cuscuta campestris]